MLKRPKECTLLNMLGSKYLKGPERSCFSSLRETSYSRKVLACESVNLGSTPSLNTRNMVLLRQLLHAEPWFTYSIIQTLGWIATTVFLLTL